MKPSILIVDDEKLLRWPLRRKCEAWGYEVEEAADCAAALAAVRANSPDLLLLDVRLPDGNGVELLRRLRDEGSLAPAVMITADPRIDDVKSAIRLGAYDYLTKPIDFEALQITIANALETSRLRQEVGTLRDQMQRQTAPLEVIGASPKLLTLIGFVRKVAASEASAILIQGESGTGKDLFARALHAGSARRDRPFVAINCSAIPEQLLESELFGHERGAFTDAKTAKKGLLESADGGTLFLDEIGEMPMLLQAKLLRVLEEQNFRRVGGLKDIVVDVRIIAASNRNLEDAVRAGQFRQDLFYRLMVIPIFIPPLRQRREDIEPLSQFFVAHYNRRFRKNIRGLSPEARELMQAYDWPGNVRELKNAIQRAMILEDGEWIRPTYLPLHSEGAELMTSKEAFPNASAAASSPEWQQLPSGRMLPKLEIPASGTSLEEMERAMVEQALLQANGNQSKAARLLDISRDALRYKMKKFHLDGGGEHEEPAAAAQPHPL